MNEESQAPRHADAPSDDVQLCKVQGCTRVMSLEKPYYKRYSVCAEHLRSLELLVDGRIQRFCQQCGKFQDIADFDDVKRSCRTQLARHSLRRRIKLSQRRQQRHLEEQLEEGGGGEESDGAAAPRTAQPVAPTRTPSAARSPPRKRHPAPERDGAHWEHPPSTSRDTHVALPGLHGNAHGTAGIGAAGLSAGPGSGAGPASVLDLGLGLGLRLGLELGARADGGSGRAGARIDRRAAMRAMSPDGSAAAAEPRPARSTSGTRDNSASFCLDLGAPPPGSAPGRDLHAAHRRDTAHLSHLHNHRNGGDMGDPPVGRGLVSIARAGPGGGGSGNGSLPETLIVSSVERAQTENTAAGLEWSRCMGGAAATGLTALAAAAARAAGLGGSATYPAAGAHPMQPTAAAAATARPARQVVLGPRPGHHAADNNGDALRLDGLGRVGAVAAGSSAGMLDGERRGAGGGAAAAAAAAAAGIPLEAAAALQRPLPPPSLHRGQQQRHPSPTATATTTAAVATSQWATAGPTTAAATSAAATTASGKRPPQQALLQDVRLETELSAILNELAAKQGQLDELNQMRRLGSGASGGSATAAVTAPLPTGRLSWAAASGGSTCGPGSGPSSGSDQLPALSSGLVGVPGGVSATATAASVAARNNMARMTRQRPAAPTPALARASPSAADASAGGSGGGNVHASGSVTALHGYGYSGTEVALSATAAAAAAAATAATTGPGVADYVGLPRVASDQDPAPATPREDDDLHMPSAAPGVDLPGELLFDQDQEGGVDQQRRPAVLSLPGSQPAAAAAGGVEAAMGLARPARGAAMEWEQAAAAPGSLAAYDGDDGGGGGGGGNLHVFTSGGAWEHQLQLQQGRSLGAPFAAGLYGGGGDGGGVWQQRSLAPPAPALSLQATAAPLQYMSSSSGSQQPAVAQGTPVVQESSLRLHRSGGHSSSYHQPGLNHPNHRQPAAQQLPLFDDWLLPFAPLGAVARNPAMAGPALQHPHQSAADAGPGPVTEPDVALLLHQALTGALGGDLTSPYHTGQLLQRLSFKLYGCSPADLLPDSRYRLQSWLASMNLQMLQLTVRSGCAHLIADVVVPADGHRSRGGDGGGGGGVAAGPGASDERNERRTAVVEQEQRRVTGDLGLAVESQSTPRALPRATAAARGTGSAVGAAAAAALPDGGDPAILTASPPGGVSATPNSVLAPPGSPDDAGHERDSTISDLTSSASSGGDDRTSGLEVAAGLSGGSSDGGDGEDSASVEVDEKGPVGATAGAGGTLVTAAAVPVPAPAAAAAGMEASVAVGTGGSSVRTLGPAVPVREDNLVTLLRLAGQPASGPALVGNAAGDVGGGEGEGGNGGFDGSGHRGGALGPGAVDRTDGGAGADGSGGGSLRGLLRQLLGPLFGRPGAGSGEPAGRRLLMQLDDQVVQLTWPDGADGDGGGLAGVAAAGPGPTPPAVCLQAGAPGVHPPELIAVSPLAIVAGQPAELQATVRLPARPQNLTAPLLLHARYGGSCLWNGNLAAPEAPGAGEAAGKEAADDGAAGDNAAEVVVVTVPLPALPVPGMAFLEGSCGDVLGRCQAVLVVPSEAVAAELEGLAGQLGGAAGGAESGQEGGSAPLSPFVADLGRLLMLGAAGCCLEGACYTEDWGAFEAFCEMRDAVPDAEVAAARVLRQCIKWRLPDCTSLATSLFVDLLHKPV